MITHDLLHSDNKLRGVVRPDWSRFCSIDGIITIIIYIKKLNRHHCPIYIIKEITLIIIYFITFCRHRRHKWGKMTFLLLWFWAFRCIRKEFSICINSLYSHAIFVKKSLAHTNSYLKRWFVSCAVMLYKGLLL
jgi:vacuolar-type H+-ATPase subunit I/STV1